MQELPLHRTIMVVDIAGFTDPIRTLADQSDVHLALYGLVERALVESGIDLNDCEIEDRGDGMMILLDPRVPKNLLVDRLPNRLVAGLKRHNATRVESAKFQLRVGLHSGEVHRNQRGAVSPAVNFAFRIVEAQEAKHALTHSIEVLAVVASDNFYQEVIIADPATNPDRYRKIPVNVKETNTTAWLYLPDVHLVQDVLPDPELDGVRGELANLTKDDVPQLLILLRRAGGSAIPPPAVCANAWDAFRFLWQFNAGDDGFPPGLEFVRLLAHHVNMPLRKYLRDWLAAQVSRLGLESVLAEKQRQKLTTPAADAQLHLLIMVQSDGIDPERCLLSYWRQEDPDEWPPARGDTCEVAMAELERQVDELVIAAERAWSAHGGAVALEFLLPRNLLGLPVHRWHKEHGSHMPRALLMDYPIVVRSLERMRSAHWHRVWRARWSTLSANPSWDSVHFCKEDQLNAHHSIDAILSSPQWTVMVLTGAPAPVLMETTGSDELLAALRAGIPALIWHPEAHSDDLREIVAWLVEDDGMADLPTRVRAARLAALRESPPFAPELLRDLVVLWDDPQRTVVVDHPAVRPTP